MQNYIYDQRLRIWSRPSSGSIAYSDGEEVENYLLSALREINDLSAASSEVVSLIRDWPSEYHLSPIRHNLLRPFNIKPSDRVLELGCGCGAMTRYLGETGATVVAVEGSRRRAQIAAERCRDLPNVTIVCDNIADFVSNEKFDIVTLVGVLEYAPLFINERNPIRACLQKASSLLIADGSLLLAIENKLGLKYFSGCKEDHLGIRYYGINNLYTSETPITFGREELTSHLNQSGFEVINYYYPFPDYKLPNLVLNELGLKSKRLNLGNLLIHGVARDYPNSYRRAFSDGLAWGAVADNNLVGDLANSFLVRACKESGTEQKDQWLAKTFSRSYRKSEFLVETTISLGNCGDIKVYKQHVFPGLIGNTSAGGAFRHVLVDSNYIDGHLLLRDIHGAIAREAPLPEIADKFSPWISYLLSHAKTGAYGKLVLPGYFIDCAPANLMVTKTGKVEYFDAEWLCEVDIPMSFVVVRGFVHSLGSCLNSRQLEGWTYRMFIDGVLSHLGYSLCDEDYREADAVERKFAEYCHHDLSRGFPLSEVMDERLSLIPRLADAEAELDRFLNSLSWRVTKPFRALALLMRGDYRAVFRRIPRVQMSRLWKQRPNHDAGSGD